MKKLFDLYKAAVGQTIKKIFQYPLCNLKVDLVIFKGFSETFSDVSAELEPDITKRPKDIETELILKTNETCLLTRSFMPGLHNAESSKGQIDQHKLAAGRKSLFRHSVEEILKEQVIIRSRAFATFSATEFSRAARKELAGRMWPAGRMLCRPGLCPILKKEWRQTIRKIIYEDRRFLLQLEWWLLVAAFVT